MIDLKQELQNFSYIDIESLSENVDNIPDNIKNSVILYNKALNNINSKSEDIAIIELKKAIALNPEFHEAMNLLGICYSYVQDYAKSAEMFERVMKEEKNSIDALRLLNLINSSEALPVKEGKKRPRVVVKEKKAYDRAKSEASDNENALKLFRKFNILNKRDIAKYVAGCGAGALLVALLSLPFYFHSAAESASNTLDDKELADSLNSELNSLKQQSDEINGKYDKLLKDKNESDKQVDYYKNAVKLFDVETLADERKYEAAADKLMLLKDVGFKDIEKSKFDEISDNVLPKAAWAVYNEGLNLLDSKKYQEALGKLTKVELYKNDLAYLDSTFYNMGLCYKKMDDSRSALDMFQKVIDTYPKSQYASYAKNRIREITGAP